MTNLSEIVAFTTSDGLRMAPLADILYCRSDGNYAAIYLNDRTSLFISRPLKDLEAFLPQELFIRIHHQVLVNKLHIRQYQKSNGVMVLSDGTSLGVAVRKRGQLAGFYRIL